MKNGKLRRLWLPALYVWLTSLLLMQGSAYASGNILITNLSTVEANPSIVTSGTIELVATINGISLDQVPDLYYIVQNVTTGAVPATDLGNKAIVSPTNPMEIRFTNVNLTAGKNKITIRLQGSNQDTETDMPAWIVYTPVTSIQNLRFNDELFANSPDGVPQLYPRQEPYFPVRIDGIAPNATRVEAYLNNDATPIESFFQNTTKEFSFIGNVLSGDVQLRPGDNLLKFVATNGVNSIETTRSFAYNDGTAFAYNAFVAEVPANAGDPIINQRLLLEPKVHTTEVHLSAYLKMPIEASSNQDMYPFVDVRLNNSSIFGGVLTSIGNYGRIPELSTPQYNVYRFEANFVQLPLGGTKFQEVEFRFHGGNPDIAYESNVYSFVYEDPNAAYVDYATWVIGTDNRGTADPSDDKDIEIRLSSNGASNINVFPATVKVYTNENAHSIRAAASNRTFACLNGAADYDADCNVYQVVQDENGNTFHMFTVRLEGLPDGNTQLLITPSTGNGPTQAEFDAGRNPEGAANYEIIVTASPYAIINSFYDGRVIRSVSDLLCGNVNSCVAGQLVNFPLPPDTAAGNYVQFRVNRQLYASNLFVIDGSGNFTVNIDPQHIVEGQNIIEILLYMNGVPVTTAQYNLFKFQFAVPSFEKIVPVDDLNHPQFLSTQTDSYETRATSVRLSGILKDFNPAPALDNAILRLYINRPGELPQEIPVPNTANFTTSDIPLPLGSTVFDFRATNNSNVTALKSVTIVRANLPYVVMQPALSKNSRGLDQANINSNFTTIVMRADGADTVMFGKVEASYDAVTGLYSYEALNLKSGENTIKFTVHRGTERLNGSIILFNLNTPIEGATHKSALSSSRMNIFNGDLLLQFPRGTSFMRNERDADHQFLTTERSILFGIANNSSGKVLRTESGIGRNRLEENRQRFRPASKLYWIDAGTISSNAANDPATYRAALTGSGRLPYEGTPFYLRPYNELVIPTQQGKLTIKYDPMIRQNAWRYLTVFFYDTFQDQNGIVTRGWKKIPGTVDTRNNTITIPFEKFGYYQVMYMDDSFNDITMHPYARNELDLMYSKGYMLSRSPSTFGPYEYMTRGEFAQLLVKIYEIPLINQDTLLRQNTSIGTFSDVILGRDYGLYDAAHIEAAARAGIVRGILGGRFEHSRGLTREDAAVMIARAAQYRLNNDLEKTTAALQKQFTDTLDINDYARSAVEAIVKAGLITGVKNELLVGQSGESYRFDPKEFLRRDQAAVIAVRVLEAERRLPR